MALSTFSELKTSIADWLARDDLTTVIPDFITLAEADMNARLRTRRMETRATATLSDATLAVPTDFLELRRLMFTSTDPDDTLPYMDPVQLRRTYADDAVGRPEAYTIIGREFHFRPSPDDSYTVEIIYFATITALSDSNTTNWILTNYPGAYLYGALAKSAPYTSNDERLPVWQRLYETEIAQIIAADKREAWNAGPLQARMDVRPPA